MAEEMFVRCKKEALDNLKEKGFDFALKDEQIQAIKYLFNGNDLLAVLPTGFGKSLIYQMLLLMSKARNARNGQAANAHILVISPLQSLIEDQILEVTSMGITGCNLTDKLDSLDEVTSGRYDIVFASAETATSKKFIECLKKATPFTLNLAACVVDETHTVETWTGNRIRHTKKHKKAFRASYGELSILRSFFKEGTPFAALTGTADDSTIATVSSILLLKECLVLKLSPNRENIRFSVMKSKKEQLFSRLDWLLDSIISKGTTSPKTIIFCNTMNDIASVTNYVMLKLGRAAYSPQNSNNPNDCLVGIYHSSSWKHNKDRVVLSMKGQGKIRLVVSSTALSMGVNFRDVRYIINWGPARNLLDLHQEIGRAGRDGLQSFAIILYHGQQLSQCEQEVKDFVKANGCLRVAAYCALDKDIKSHIPPHSCCSFCAESCTCAGTECGMEKPPFEMMDAEVSAASPSMLSRPVSEEDENDLKEALKEVQKTIVGQTAVFDIVSCHGFSNQLIEDIIKNCCYIFSIEDILKSCPVYSYQHAILILEVIQEHFLDIPNFDESIDIIREANTSSNAIIMADLLSAIELTDNECPSSDDEDLEDAFVW